MAEGGDHVRISLKKAGKLAAMTLEKYKNLVYMFDQSGDGLKSEMLHKMMIDLNMGIPEEVFSSYMEKYENEDGFIDASGLMNALLDSDGEIAQDEFHKKDGEGEKILKDIYKIFDREERGGVEEQQFGEILKILQIPISEEHTAKMYSMFDLSGDKNIDYMEFLEGLKNRIGLKKILI